MQVAGKQLRKCAIKVARNQERKYSKALGKKLRKNQQGTLLIVRKKVEENQGKYEKSSMELYNKVGRKGSKRIGKKVFKTSSKELGKNYARKVTRNKSIT